MNTKTCLIAGCLPLAIGGVLLVLMAAAFLGIGGIGGEGEETASTQGSADNGPSVDAGPVSDEVPSVLAELFSEAGGAIGVPTALLAAISHQECGRTWSIPEEKLQDFISKNQPFPIRQRDSRDDMGHMGCAYDNGSNVWGPMQFQYMTFFGYPRCARVARKRCVLWTHEGKNYTDRWAQSFISQNPSFHPRNDPQPGAGSNGDQAGSFTKKPASILSMKDAVYAAAIKLRADAGRTKKPKSADWTPQEVGKAACRYYGRCTFDGVNYHGDIMRKYEQFKKSGASS